MFRRWAEKINTSLIREWDMSLQIWYKDPTPADEASADDHYTKAINKWMTVNEVRDEIGLMPVEGGDVIYQPLGQLPLGENVFEAGEESKSIVKMKSKNFISKRDKKLSKIYNMALKGNRWLRFQEDIFKDAVEETLKSKKTKKGYTKKQKDLLWKIFDVRLQKWEQYWYSFQKQLFTAQGKRIRKQLKDNAKAIKKDNPINEVDWDKENEIFTKKSIPVITEVITEAGEYAMNQIGKFGFDPTDEITAKWIDKKAITFAKEINKTTKKRLKNSLAEGLGEGEGIPKLAKRVSAVMAGRIKSSAETIARTEVLSSSNAGTMHGYGQSGIVKKKEWLATRDAKTRDEHGTADGQVVLLKNDFVIAGEKLSFPGDPKGSPGNIINCRCTILPVLSE